MTICLYCGKLGGHWGKDDTCSSPNNPENRVRAAAEWREAGRREKAERIARAVADEAWHGEPDNITGPEKSRNYNLRLNAARAAALAALTEKENAR